VPADSFFCSQIVSDVHDSQYDEDQARVLTGKFHALVITPTYKN